jgi:voltage-gated potassium channel
MENNSKIKSIQVIKEKVFQTLDYPESKTFLASLTAFFLVMTSVISGLIVILETDVNLESQYSLIFIGIEIFVTLIFITEYILRFWSSPINPEYKNSEIIKLKYGISFMGMIDLVTAVLFTLTLLLPFENEGLKIAGLYRLIVFLKLVRYSESFEVIWAVVKRKKEELLITLMLSLLLMFFGATIIYIAEHDAQPDKFTNLFSSMWFTAINLFTIGYGEMVPITPLGKITSAIVSVLGITLFLLPVSVIGSGFIDEIQERNPHYDVCPNCNKAFQKGALLRDLNQKRRGRPSKIMKLVLEAQKAKEIPKLTPRQQKLRKYYKLIQFRFPRTFAQLIIFFFFMTFITLNVLAIMVETNPTLSQELRVALNSVYIFSIIVFTIEYILRIWSCPASEEEKYEDSNQGRLKYVRSPFAIVDLIVIIGLFLMLIPDQLVPVSRRYFLIPLLFVVFKIGHFIDVFSISGLIFKETKREFLGTLFICIIFLIFSSAAIYYVENRAQPNKFSSIPATLWFGIVTFTTTGFGDIYPVTTLGRFMTVCFAFVGVALFTLPSGILGASFFSSMQEYRLHKICPNCGYILSKPKIRK